VQLRGGQRLDLQHLAPGGAALGRSRGGRRRPIISSARLSASVAAVSTVATMRPARMALTRSVTRGPPSAYGSPAAPSAPREPAQHGEKPLALLRGTSVTVRPGGSGRR
jgi:hypothetical protein